MFFEHHGCPKRYLWGILWISNIAEKVIFALGEPAFRDLQALFLQEILPSSLEELQQSLPAEINLSDIQLPEGVELPETIELPAIKLPESKN